ncbi:MAG: hypothetical protein OEV44_00405 [Spirochaetota bacterium]|nr:hypothetical protein [Spirochaetota bacterium]
MKSNKINEKNFENILEVSNMLTDNGQRDLALDLLTQYIRQYELESQGLKDAEKENIEKLRIKLEDKFKEVNKKKPGLGLLGYHSSKVAITVIGVIIIFWVGSIFANSIISNTINILQNKIDHGISKMKETDRLRLLGLLTHNPEVHYQWSLYQERNGKIKEAVQEMELAMGLIEPDKELYRDRLKKLKNKLKLTTK